jgi:hypothetical protein
MNRSWKKARLLLLLIALTMTAGISREVKAADIPAVEVSGKLRWVYDYEQGKQLARQNGKPLFVVFRCER